MPAQALDLQTVRRCSRRLHLRQYLRLWQCLCPRLLLATSFSRTMLTSPCAGSEETCCRSDAPVFLFPRLSILLVTCLLQ
jgi:hypothetical protein